MMKKGLKYILWIVGTLFALLILVYILLLNGIVQNKIKEYALTQLNREINGTINVVDLNTNLFSNLNLNEIIIYDSKKDTLAFIHKLNIDYKLKALLYHELKITNFQLDSFYIIAQQNQDNWNFEDLIPPSTEDHESGNKSSSAGFSIHIRNLALSRGEIITLTDNKYIPQKVSNLNTAASIIITKNRKEFQLTQFSTQLAQPNLEIKDIRFDFSETNDAFSLQNLKLITGSSDLTIDQALYNTDSASVSGQLLSDNSKELQVLLPDIHLNSIPKVEFDYHEINDTLSIQLVLSVPEERIETIVHLCKSAEGPMPIKGRIKLQNIKPESWWQMDSTFTSLNGTVEFSSIDVANYLNKHQLQLKLKKSILYKNKVDSLWAHINQTDKIINTELAVYADSSSVSGKVILIDPDLLQQYSANLLFDGLHIKALDYKYPHQSLLNGSVTIKGSGFNTDSLLLNSTLRLHETNIYGIYIDSAQLAGNIFSDTINLEYADINTPYTKMHTQGQYFISDSTIIAQSSLKSTSATEVKNFYDLPATFELFSSDFKISGKLDSLIIEGESKIQDIDAYDVQTKDIHLQADAKWLKEQLSSEATIYLVDLKNEDVQLDSSKIHIQYTDTLLAASLIAYSDTLSGIARASYYHTDSITIKIDSLNVGGPKQRFFTCAPITSQLSEERIAFSPIHIKSSQDSTFAIKADGALSTTGNQQVELSINEFSLQTLYDYGLTSFFSTHTVNANLVLSGTAHEPNMNGEMRVSEGQLDALYTPELKANFSWLGQELQSTILIPDLKDQFKASINMPLSAKFTNNKLSYQTPETFDASLQIDSIHIADALNRRKLNIKAEGILSANIQAKGSFDAPALYGNVDLDRLNYTDRKQGIKLEDALMRYVIDSNKVRIDTFLLKRKKGLLDVDGEIAFNGSMIKGSIKEVNVDIKAKEFYFSRHRDHTLLIDGNTQFTHNKNENSFDGDIRILQSSLNLSKLSQEDETHISKEKPILIEALYQNDTILISNQDTITETDDLINVKLDAFIKTLQGHLSIHIPRNTWLKSKEMKIELMGDVEVIKNNPYFELFGAIEINRGFYALYGKKFDIEVGGLVFEGGEEPDPQINLRAIYTYRAPDKQKRKLRLIASGNLSEPKISFELDNSDIPNADAVSILFVGKTMDEINSHQKNDSEAASVGNIAAQAVGNQLGKLIDKSVGMDMIEVKASDDWKNTSFVLGKYITRDLFVKFQRSFGENADNDEISREKITLEYELNRNLFFSVQSGTSKDMGADVIIKFEQKVK